MKVHCDRSIRVAAVLFFFALVCHPVFGTFTRPGRCTCHLCSPVLTYFDSFFYWAGRFTCDLFCFFKVLLSFHTVHDDWLIHVSSGLTAFSGRKLRDNRMLHSTLFVSWIVLDFVGLREVSELSVCTEATDRAETCEVLEEGLHEVEAEVKELRVGSCWKF